MRRLFNFAGVTKDEVRDIVALGITIGLMLSVIFLVLAPMFLLAWRGPQWIIMLIVGVIGYLFGYLLGHSRAKRIREEADESTLEWG